MYTRSREAQAEYDARLARVRREWVSVEDVIRAEELGWGRERVGDGDDARWRAVPSAARRRRALSPNPFPYSLPADTEHWVLWADEEAPPAAEDVERFVARHAPDWARSYTLLRNEPAQRSVPGIFHVHVFLRRAAEPRARRGT